MKGNIIRKIKESYKHQQMSQLTPQLKEYVERQLVRRTRFYLSCGKSKASDTRNAFINQFIIIKKPIQSVVRITFDFRHVVNNTNSKKNEFIYGQNWEILIAVKQNFTLDDLQQDLTPYQVQLPSQFLVDQTDKLQAHVFRLFAYQELTIVLYIKILTNSFTNLRMLFIQTASIVIEEPYRAIYGQNKIFPFVLKNDQVVNLPLNLPTSDLEFQEYPSTLIAYSPYNTSESLVFYNLTSNQNKTYQSNQIYWSSDDQIVIPYVPYMSNCKGSGAYIYLHEYIENSSLCTLYPPDKTVPVEQIGFKQNAVSDTCEKIIFECILEEAFNDNNNYPRFFEQSHLTELFYISEEAINLNDYLWSSNAHSSLSLIPVISTNEVPSQTLPKIINLDIDYFQVDKYTKKIIKAEMTFQSFIDISTQNLTTPFLFNFTLNLHSMSHAELAVAFALQWQIYLLLSCLIGAISICFTLIYHLYFRIANLLFRRQMIKQKYSFKCNMFYLKQKWESVKHYANLYQPIIVGICLGVLPSFILHTIASLIMLGAFWSLSIFKCSVLTADGICELSVLELVVEHDLTQYIRRGRLGYSLIIIGLYGVIRISGVFLASTTEDRINQNVDDKIQDAQGPEEQKILKTFNRLIDRKTVMVTECYDGNIWFQKLWQRGLYLHMALIIWAIMLVILNLSFSTFYGDNQWLFVGILKITQVFIEESMKIYMENELLIGSLSCVISMTLAVSGLGALDFFEYLFTYFVNLGISTFEKTNQVLLVHYISHRTFSTVDKFKQWIQRQFDYEISEEEEDDDNRLQTAKGINQDDSDYYSDDIRVDTDNSVVMLTERYEDSMDNTFEDNDNISVQQMDVQNQKKKVLFSLEAITQANQQQNRGIQKNGNGNEEQDTVDYEELDDSFEEQFQQLFENKINKYKHSSQAESVKQKNQFSEIEQRSSQIIKVYSFFCNSSFTLIQTVVQMWMFYDASQTFVKWHITKAGLIFYFLFNVSNIPFQIVMDLLFLKTVEQLHQLYIKDYVIQVRQRFQNRKYNWKADDEEDHLKKINEELVLIDRWCYSSQYFFCQSIFVGGILFSLFITFSSMSIIQGFLTILANEFNFLKDGYSLVITLFWILICFLVDMVCVSIYNYFSFWKVKNKKNLKRYESYEQILTTENQQFLATEMFTQEFHQDKKLGDLEEESKQPFNLFNNASRDNIFIKQNSEVDQYVRQQLNSKQLNMIRFNNNNNDLLDLENKCKEENNILKEHFNQIEQQKQLLSSKRSLSFIGNNSYQQDQLDHFENLKELIQNNRYIKFFTEKAIQSLSEEDISVQNLLVSLFDKNESFNLTLEEKFEKIKDKYKRVDHDPSRKKRLWMSIKDKIKNSVDLKTKKMKLKDIMLKFEKNEFKDEVFRQKYLSNNRKWFEKNSMLLFKSLMVEDSKRLQQRLKSVILEGFQGIYGDLDKNIPQIQIGQKADLKINLEDIQFSLQARTTKTTLNNVVSIVRYWMHRSRVQRLAEKGVSGFILKGEKASCFYCKTSWGIMMQLNNTNIEDLFLSFYKKECRKQRKYVNVFQITNGYVEQRSKQWNSLNSKRQSKTFESDFPLDKSMTDSLKDQDLEINSYFITRQQKFIESWQGFFFKHSKFIHVCLKCNDIAQTAYSKQLSIKRLRNLTNYLEEYQNYFKILNEEIQNEETEFTSSPQSQNSPFLICNFNNFRDQISKDSISEKDDFNSPRTQNSEHVYPQSQFHQYRKINTIQAQNTIIEEEEENNDIQSQVDFQNKVESEEMFYSPQPQRKKTSVQSKFSLNRSRSSSKNNSQLEPYKQSPLKLHQIKSLKFEVSLEEMQSIRLQSVENEDKDTKEQVHINKDLIDDQQPNGNITNRSNKSNKSGISHQKTHPEKSQNNLDDLHLIASNREIIQQFNQNLEQTQNNYFRLIDKIGEDNQTLEDDFNFTPKNQQTLHNKELSNDEQFNDVKQSQLGFENQNMVISKININKIDEDEQRQSEVYSIQSDLLKIENIQQHSFPQFSSISFDQFMIDNKEQENEKNISQSNIQLITPVKHKEKDVFLLTEEHILKTEIDTIKESIESEEDQID